MSALHKLVIHDGQASCEGCRWSYSRTRLNNVGGFITEAKKWWLEEHPFVEAA